MSGYSPKSKRRAKGVEESDIKKFVESMYGLYLISYNRQAGYFDYNYHVKVRESSVNPYIPKPSPHGYILKISNPEKSTELIEAEHSMMTLLNENDITAPKPQQNVHGAFYSLEELSNGDKIGKDLVTLGDLKISQKDRETNVKDLKSHSNDLKPNPQENQEISLKDLEADSDDLEENSKDLELNSQDFVINSKYLVNSIELEVNSKDLKKNFKDLEVNSTDREINSDRETLSKDPKTHNIVRLLEYIPGEVIMKVPYTAKLLYDAGRLVGKLDSILKEFNNAFFRRRVNIPWSLYTFPGVVINYVDYADPDDRNIVVDVIETFNREVVPVYDKLQSGLIHGDASHENILVTQFGETSENILVKQISETSEIVGIIDMEMCQVSQLVFEIGITIAYLMLDAVEFECLDVGGHVLAGYLTKVTLNPTERSVVRVAVAARMVQSMVMGRYMYSKDPSNKGILTTQSGWPALRRFWGCTKFELYKRWDRIIAEHQRNGDE